MSIEKKISPMTSISNEDQVVIVGNTFEIKGDINGLGAVIISGKIEGNVSASQIVIESGASVIGNVTCLQLDISGHVRGLIESGNVIVRENATIEGDLNYSSLAIESGGTVTGKLKQVSSKSPGNADAGPKNFQSPRVPTQTVTHISFPVDLSQKLRSHESRMSAHLSLLDGSPVPVWIRLNQDRLGLTVNSLELQQLEDSNLNLELRLHVGSQFFDFKLPI